ncbi:OLC1v1017116C1 [Oldenlandia corymbosa var. corymbosa]|uniref:OLC1v1017116C1 n=1 Tax=Oldenlandia corymbosa var. corymbosa TaxID=529605 RepID=A0AAV1E8W1_OLDCO|nr:OLC1v1017116C1 [Oldenlandia corymbosa var. corymbosa]
MASTVTVLKQSSVSPPPSSSPTEMSLPLTFLDMIWLHFLPIQRLMFYEIPNLSTAHFIDHIIPKLETSLSITLQNYLPLAGNLIIPSGSGSNPRMPEIRYLQGDSVSVTFSECNEVDCFSHLTADVARNCREFHSLVPELFKTVLMDEVDSSSDRVIPVLGIQATLFPDSGISIGISNHHSVGDARTIFQFMKTWANLSFQLHGDRDSVSAKSIVSENPPIFDRNLIHDSKGLASVFFQRWNGIIEFVKTSNSFSVDDFLNKINVNVRKTFVITRKDIEKLKSLAIKNGERLLHLSSFTVVCAYVWTCLVKSRAPSGEDVSEQDPELFSFYADCRGRMNPRLPETYFGNCLTHCLTTSEYGKLVGEEGFQTAGELIGKTIHGRLKSSETIFSGAEKWMEGPTSANLGRDVGVAGSPKFSYYSMDFGWGKPKSFEFVSIDLTGAISLSGSRESDGSVEVGISIPKPKMEAFSTIFREGLEAL